ncbi:NirD/YgiW/YdeI family stress tolerance protein [Marinobacter orientalis]|uniref:NirD/YgiW/YdeI family stress tolerance protein n=1 Tax=Marinobacter orientalis TaxID=1928859 RepID=A0A7Y0WTN3_9GAMM|nr:NirD/YgiW/YdeI family stress tolerance protein [Marinobacter orientalis]NMT65021.1 NirD/YgiW/YdeI family stress tolerance protein [Marinobacter orientalis]TGX48087.1 NirD/YgiW/YdeI family stress tolerance protein [Marinobacter orientalis]
MKSKPVLASFFIASILATLPALAAEEVPQKQDGSWIVLSGKVASTKDADTFMLNYGGDTVRIELDNWSWADLPGQVLEGDKVKVYGRVDQDTYETETIEADSVYVEDLGIHFHGGAGGEEAFTGVAPEPQPPVRTGDLSVSGRVENIENRTFTIDTGSRELTVDTSMMNYDPLKEPGLRNRSVDVGDLVTVSGQMNPGVFERRELNARSIVIRARSPVGMDESEGTAQPAAPATQPKPVEP